MNVGQSIRTLPTVKPKLYAGKVGTIAVRNEDEFGVLINGKIVWFVGREIEEWMQPTTTVTSARNGKIASAQTKTILTTGATNAGTVSSVTSAVGSGQTTMSVRPAPLARATGHLPAPAATTDRSLGTQERAREWTAGELAARESGPVPDGSVPGPPQRPVTNPPRAVPGSERPSEPRPPSAASRGSGDLTGFNPGERGPGGGVVAKCVACGGLWERPKQRGRPSLKCEGCR